MKRNQLVFWTVSVIVALVISAGISSCSKAPVEDTYMWYPGQLAAYLQTRLRQESRERCKFVGYPGKFFPPKDVAYFRTKAKEADVQAIKWSSPGDVTVSNDNGYAVFTVKTDGTRLPSLFVEGIKVSDWEASFDAQTWVRPENDSRFNSPAKCPDNRQEITVPIAPASVDILENGDIVIDFHELEMGDVKFTAEGKAELSFFVGESLMEVMSDNTARNEQVDIPVEAVDGKRTITLPERALRYLRISPKGECKVSDISFETHMWPVQNLMTFECSDEGFNAIFNQGVKTLHTSLHNFYLDGIKRDYLPWAMDAVLGTIGGDYLFGDRQVTRNGISVALMPPHPQTSDWGIPDYPLHALIGIEHDYMRYGDFTTADMFKDRILDQMALYESVQDEYGFLTAERPSSGFTPGWARKEGPESMGRAAYAQMMLKENFRITAFLCKHWGDKELAARYEKRAEELSASIMKHFWSEEKKAFIDGYKSDGSLDERVSPHAQYWGVISGLYPEKYYDALYTEVLPSIPSYYKDVSYDKGYEVMAYAKAGHIKECLVFLDRVFGDWIRQGHTRFPENFQPEASKEEQLVFYRRPFGLSLCHGANGTPGVAAALFGIIGFSQDLYHAGVYTIKPDLAGMQWAKATFPVAEGTISVEVRGKDVTVTSPKGCRVKIDKSKL